MRVDLAMHAETEGSSLLQFSQTLSLNDGIAVMRRQDCFKSRECFESELEERVFHEGQNIVVRTATANHSPNALNRRV